MHKHSDKNSAQIRFDNVSLSYYSKPKWLGGKAFRALHPLSLCIETQDLAIIGPSGAGKSSLIELMFGLRKPSSGEIYICEHPLSKLNSRMQKSLSHHIQLIPQEPQSSLNPYFSVREILQEPLKNIGALCNSEQKIQQILTEVGLDISLLNKNATALSVGQAQRVAIARALIVEPCVLVADEPTSSLDPLSRAQIISLLQSIQRQRQMRLILVSHDLPAALALCDDILVLDKGQVVEQAKATSIMIAANHPTTKALLDANFDTNQKDNHVYSHC